MREKLFLNTHDAAAAVVATRYRLGLEVDSYIWPLTPAELQQARQSVAWMTQGINRLTMHGPLISSDLDTLATLDWQEVRIIYDQAYASARLHQIDRLVFHSGFVPGRHDAGEWLQRASLFWSEFLADKPPGFAAYIENMVDDDPALLARLCDQIADARIQLCLDVGHAHCNSTFPVSIWIEALAGRIGHMHLHSNDGTADRHWPLGKGTLDIDAVLQQVRLSAPNATYTLECDFVPSLEWLVQHGYLALLD